VFATLIKINKTKVIRWCKLDTHT